MDRALRVMRYVLTAATIAVCLLLCWQAVDIYLTGNSPENFSAPGVRIAPVYSREIVGSRLAAASPALFAYLALVTAGLALQAAAGERPGRRLPVPAEMRLRSLRRRTARFPRRRRGSAAGGGTYGSAPARSSWPAPSWAERISSIPKTSPAWTWRP